MNERALWTHRASEDLSKIDEETRELVLAAIDRMAGLAMAT